MQKSGWSLEILLIQNSTMCKYLAFVDQKHRKVTFLVVYDRVYALCEALFIYYNSFLKEDEQKENKDNMNKVFNSRNVINKQRQHKKVCN